MGGDGCTGRHIASRARALSPHTDDSMVAAVRRVAANPDNKDISMFNGFSANPYQLIGSRFLSSPSRAVMYDWSHCYLQDGLADKEFGEFMAQYRDIAIYSELADYCSQFVAPRAYRLTALFDPPKIRQALKTHKFKCDCSELMTLAPMIARYVREVVRFGRVENGRAGGGGVTGRGTR